MDALQGRRDEYVKTLVGRYRHPVPPAAGELKKRVEVRCVQTVSNTPIQGRAAMVSIAMRNINRRLKDERYSRDEAQIVLQVHDN